ncbi:MAG: ATP-binding protein [Gammaproteobacteria bacterium]
MSTSLPRTLRHGSDAVSELGFLAGGGEMGARMRALDWAKTPLGAPAQWPQSLKTIVRVMLDSRYAMWMLWGPDYTFFCNDAYLPTVGIKGNWVLGARSDKVWEEIWPDIGPRIARVLELGQATWDEALLLFLERSGFPEETYHTFSYSPVYNDDSRIEGMLCVVTEVTDRVIGERRLRVLRDLAARTMGAESVEESCERLCGVLGQYSMDTPFSALYLQEAHDRFQCYARSADVSSDVLPLTLTDGDSSWPLAQLLRDGAPQELINLPQQGICIPAGPWPDLVQTAVLLPLRGSGTDTRRGFLMLGISPRRPFDGAYQSFLDLVVRQVAAAIADAQAYDTQRRRAEALAEIDRAKTVFFSNVSHEFRTPLTLMLGPVEEAIADARLPKDVRDRMTLVQRNALRLLKLVNSLLDFARIEAGRVQASFEPTDAAALTRDLASTFRSTMERAGLRFEVECDDLDELLYIDREMWEKIVLNLLSNAFKFTLRGEIDVRLRREGTHAVLTVADTGVGVPEKELPRLFDRFHRVEGSEARTQEGSGIGLALVQELVKLHGATIEVVSEPKLGSTFRVRIPFGSAHLPPESLRRPQTSNAATLGAQAFVQEALRWLPDAKFDGTLPLPALVEASNSARDPRFANTFGARVILADDNADMRAYVRELLSPAYAVETVADGEQALRAARELRPDLILTDIMMPRLDGFGLLAAIRQDESLRSVPVVLLSARAGEEARIEGFDAGADDYLIKPFSARELIARVGALLELGGIRREAEHALRLRSAQFQTLLNEAPLGVYLVDADFRIKEVNPTAQSAFGDIANLIGRDFDEVIHIQWQKDHADELVQMFKHTLHTGEAYISPERIHERLDHRVVEVYEWQINRIELPDGRYGVVCYFRDISNHVRARKALQDADRQKDEFLAMLAHELRNPLAPIQNASTLLAAITQHEPRAQFSVGVIKRQITQLTRLVDDLLDVSRITQGRIELKREPLELAAIIAQAVEVVDPLFRERGHTVSIAAEYMPLHVQGDNARLVQCIGNVLTNAAKYTDPGGEIQIRSFSQGDDAVLRITDNGVGISPDLLPRIFDLFVQSDRTLDRSQGGLGIGLSVVKRLIEMHGGQADVRSEGIGRGTLFEIRLPRIKRSRPTQNSQQPPEVAAQRILVVDDNVDAADTLALLLQLEGHQTEAVYESTQALEKAKSFNPHVVLLDIGLPGMNGYELAEKLRSLPELTGVRLIALTGYGKAEDHDRTTAAGFDHHLVKPVDALTLQQALATPTPTRGIV